MPHRLYRQIARRAGYRCEYCRAPEAISPGCFEVEHIMPRARGGSDDPANLALACSPCNSRKSQATQGIDTRTLTIVPLFNPRQDIWDTHFRIRDTEDESGEYWIDGLTPTGRVTVDRLRMNDAHVIRARLLWALAKLFPP
jgi:hypothetical protein